MKTQVKKYLPKKCFLFGYVIFLVLLFLPFYSFAQEKSDHEVRGSLQELVNSAVHLTEKTVDAEKHIRHWPKPEFRDKWSKRTYAIKRVKVKIQKVEGQLHPYEGMVFGNAEVRTQGPFDTKKAALSAYPMVQNPTLKRAAFQLKYVFEDDKWVLQEGLLAPYESGTGHEGSWKPIWSPYHGGSKDRRWGVIHEYWAQKSY